MITTFLAVLPIFLLIVTGWLCKQRFVAQPAFWLAADKLVYYLFFPCLLILEIGSADFSGGHTGSALMAAIGATLLVGALVFLVRLAWRMPNDLFTSIFQGSTRYNSYVFIALSQALFGDAGVALSGVFIAWMVVLTNFSSVLVMNRYGDGSSKALSSIARSIVSNPLIAAALLGLLLNVMGWRIEGAARQFMAYLGHAATPLSLMSVGAGLMLVMHPSKTVATVLATVLKLLVLPLLTWGLLKLGTAHAMPAQIALLYAAMPCAGNAYILARQMGGDAEAMASIITWSTLASVLTITLIMGSAMA